MSWNGSAPSKKQCEGQTSKCHANRIGRRIYILVVAISLLMVSSIIFLMNQENDFVGDEEEYSRHGRIAAATPQMANSTNEVAVAPEIDTKVLELRKKIYIDEKGVARYPGGLRVQDGPADHRFNVAMSSRKKMLFRHLCENEIAMLITVQPGELIVGPSTYGQRFVRDFTKSLQEEIKDDDTDTPEEHAVRAQVREIKKDLAKRMAKGEDIAKIMTDARQELQEAYQYRQNLAKELARIKKDPSYKDSDIVDFVTAANEMLEKKGITIGKFRPGFRQGIKLKLNKKGENE